MGSATTPRKNAAVTSSQACASIRQIATTHDLLSDTIQLFNDCYSAHLIQSLTPLGLFTVFAYFGLIHAYASNADVVTMRAVWNNIMYHVFFFTVILQLVTQASLVGSDVCWFGSMVYQQYCFTLHLQCKRIAIMTHKAIGYGTLEERIVDALRAFSQQLDHHAPKISCGLFDLDWPLFYSVRQDSFFDYCSCEI